MSNYNSLQLELDNSIATVTLSRPKVLNALNQELLKELSDIFNSLNRNTQIRVIIMQGTGKSFCAGIDLKAMQRITTAKIRNDSIINRITSLYRTINTCSKPVIGKVHGYIVGSGLGLCAVCDIVIAADTSTFSLPEVRIGITPALIAPYTVSRIGISNFRALGIIGEAIGAIRAQEIGLVDQVVPGDKLNYAVSEKVKQLMAASPKAIAQFKRFCHDMDNADAEKLTLELWNSPEGQEGIKALLEKRSPRWAPRD